MKRTALMVGALVLALAPVIADAGSHKDKSSKNKNKGGASFEDTRNCPPGLAKKNTGCLPPGQAKKYGRGDILGGDYVFIDNPERYGLKRGDAYYRSGDYVYRVNKDTREVLDLIGAIDAILK